MSILSMLSNTLGPKNKDFEIIILSKEDRIKNLSEKEYAAFLFLIEGYTLKFCTEKMGVKFSEIKSCQQSIFKKLAVKNQTELIVEYNEFAKT